MLYIDTNILIYLLEDHGQRSQQVATALKRFSKQAHPFVTSVLTITEFLAGTECTDSDILYKIPNLGFHPLDTVVAEQAARLQRQHDLRIGDALHLATAQTLHASRLFTNDKQLTKIASGILPVVTLDEAA